jgi:hypothetical protein
MMLDDINLHYNKKLYNKISKKKKKEKKSSKKLTKEEIEKKKKKKKELKDLEKVFTID